MSEPPTPQSWGVLAAMLGLVFGAVFLIHSCAHAHDKWQDGSPVPAWVKQYCCGPNDVHHYRYDEVKVTPQGFVLPDYPTPIPADDPAHVFKSEDGDYWAFFLLRVDGTVGPVYCLFYPPGST